MYGPFQVSLSFLERISSSVADPENQTLGWRYIVFNATSGYDAFQMIMNAKGGLATNGRVDSHFLSFMWAMQRSTKSTDPRDKVFALMGIKPPDSPPFVTPSYIRSTAEIYMDAARSWIEETKDLTVFSIIEGNEIWMCKCNNPIPGLPSWAPNWSQVSRHVILYLSVSGCSLIKSHTQAFHGVRPFSFVDNAPSLFASARGILYKSLDALSASKIQLRVEGNLIAKVDRLIPISFDGGYSYFDGLVKFLRINAIMEHLKTYRQTLS